MSVNATSKMSRRGFVGTAACGAAAMAAASVVPGIALGDAAAAAEPESWDEECDVLILGAGGTGLSAACRGGRLRHRR